MSQQNYKNHIRFYPAHHFIFYPLLMISFAFAIYGYMEQWNVKLIWGAVLIILFFLGWLSFMLRQHYAMINQNRIVRLEMRLRYFILTQQPFDSIEQKLSLGQIAALRFAGNDEFLDLLERTIKENLDPTSIKKAIKNWVADDMRV